MRQEGRAGAGHGPSRSRFGKLFGIWGRVAACATLALGLAGVPAGGLASASASPLDHGAHGFGGRGFGSFGSGRHGRSITGEVTGILSASEFSLGTARGTTFDVYVSSATTYTEPGVPSGTTVGFASLAVGQKVQVRGSEPTAGTFDATSVKIPEVTVRGAVSGISGAQITLTSVVPALTSTSSTVVVDTSTATLFKEAGVSNASISNIQVGDRVEVTGTQSGLVSGALTIDATRVVIPLVSYIGTIGNLGASGFTLTSTSSTVTVTVDVTSTTRYFVPRVSSATISNLSNGLTARVTGDQEGTDTVSATVVQVLGNGHFRGRGSRRHGFGFGFGRGANNGQGPGANSQWPGGDGQGTGGSGQGGGHHGFGSGGGPGSWGGRGRR